MYRLFSLTLAAIAGIGTLAELVTRGDPPEVVGEITGLAVASFWGFFGTYFYLLHAQRKIEQLAAKGDLDPDSLARAGGVNWDGALAFAVGSAALALLEAAIS